jgi:hypothetical protein
MTNTYILSDTKSDFTKCVNEGSIKLDSSKQYEAAFISLEMYNSIPNIIEGKNNMFAYDNGNGIWKVIKLLTGSYELPDINNEIQRQMAANGDCDGDSHFITITANVSRGTSIINITNESYFVDLNIENTIGTVLGFGEHSMVLGFGYNESELPVDIMHINSILVNVDIIKGSYVNQAQSQAIHSFYPKVPFGYKIIEIPAPELIWYPVITNNLSRIRLWLTDQNNKPIDTRGERLDVRICVREVSSIKHEIIEAYKYLKKEKII